VSLALKVQWKDGSGQVLAEEQPAFLTLLNREEGKNWCACFTGGAPPWVQKSFAKASVGNYRAGRLCNEYVFDRDEIIQIVESMPVF
jgi:hypothetical protein